MTTVTGDPEAAEGKTPEAQGNQSELNDPDEEQASPPFDPSERQALVIFNHAAEEIRFFKSQQWKVTNYALIAYGALAAAPPLIADCKEVVTWFCVIVNVASAFAVLITAYLAYRVLGSLHHAHDKELARMKAARRELPLVKKIHSRFRLVDSGAWWKRPRVQKILIRFKLRRGDSGTRPGRVIWVLHTAIFIGAVLAMVINLLRVPWARVWASLSAGSV